MANVDIYYARNTANIFTVDCPEYGVRLTGFRDRATAERAIKAAIRVVAPIAGKQFHEAEVCYTDRETIQPPACDESGWQP